MNHRFNLRSLLERGDRESIAPLINRLPLTILEDELGHMTPRRALQLCSFLEPPRLTALMERLDRNERQRLLSSATTTELTNLFLLLPLELVLTLLDQLPARLTRQIIAGLPEKIRQEIDRSLPWPADSVGLLMTKGWVALQEEDTVAQALARIRNDSDNRERCHTCFVLKPDQTFLGSISLEDLVLADPDKPIIELLENNPVALTPYTEQDEAARQMSRYDRDVLPVIHDGKLVGMITFDDVLDLIDQENTELFFQMAGLGTGNEEVQPGMFAQIRRRLPCLLLCLVTGVMTTSLLGRFEHALSSIVALSFFIPLLIDTGGNTGAQASTLIIRSMALDELPDTVILKVLGREIAAGLLLGGAMACLAIGRAWLLGTPPALWLVISLAMICVVTLSNVIGTILPFGLRKLGMDPALLSGPLLSTIVDVTGLAVYLGIATKVLLK